MKCTFVILGLAALCLFVRSEDLRLAPDGASLLAVNVVTNVVTREVLVKAERDALTELANAKQAAANAEFKLAGIRRYLTTLDAMLKMRETGTNVVKIPITLSTNVTATVPAPTTNTPVESP